METSERQREAAQRAEEDMRDRAIGRIRNAMCQKGDEFCVDCGNPIGAKRRAAMPSAIRCISCQTSLEKK